MISSKQINAIADRMSEIADSLRELCMVSCKRGLTDEELEQFEQLEREAARIASQVGLHARRHRGEFGLRIVVTEPGKSIINADDIIWF